jgi:hypothetical protein
VTAEQFQFGTWYPIESAPKDGTDIDVWVVERDARTFTQTVGSRVSNAAWCSPNNESREAWCVYRSPYWEDLEPSNGGKAAVVTHWMPLPPPPSSPER